MLFSIFPFLVVIQIYFFPFFNFEKLNHYLKTKIAKIYDHRSEKKLWKKLFLHGNLEPLHV